MTDVAVIIPLYKARLTHFEEISIKQCFTVLSNHKIIAVKPKKLNLDNGYNFNLIESFDDEFFANIEGYNRLLLSPEFYERFLEYKYILIYQPDAFVFRDELLDWCNSGYDYIGAPWLRETAYPDFIKKVKSRALNFIHIKRNFKQPNSDLPTNLQLENQVGNGGFSLRHTKKFYDICLGNKEMITLYNSKKDHRFNEDIFWGIEVNRKHKLLKIPNYKEAVFFSMETNLEHAFQITNGRLPFGCHAWDRYLAFWKPKFNEIGIQVKQPV